MTEIRRWKCDVCGEEFLDNNRMTSFNVRIPEDDPNGYEYKFNDLCHSCTRELIRILNIFSSGGKVKFQDGMEKL